MIGGDPEKYVIVAPDEGAKARLGDYTRDLGVEVVVMDKKRDPITGKIRYSAKNLKNKIKGKTCIVIDDMIDSAGTLMESAKELKENGATEFISMATLSIFTGEANKRLNSSLFDKVIVTNAIVQPKQRDALSSKLEVLDAAPLIADYFMGRLACKHVMTRGERRMTA